MAARRVADAACGGPDGNGAGGGTDGVEVEVETEASGRFKCEGVIWVAPE